MESRQSQHVFSGAIMRLCAVLLVHGDGAFTGAHAFRLVSRLVVCDHSLRE